jgi:tetratricopeptide (TPR) repeat protein
VFRPRPYDRAEVLAEAEQARGRRRWKKAVAAYRRILEHEPDDFVVHGKLAPLLVDDEPRAAWTSFERAARGHAEKGFADRALSMYRQAADALPFIAEAWEQVAELHRLRGHRADAVMVLLEGQAHFWRRREDLPTAVRLLERLLAMEPWHLEGTLAVARALARQGDPAGGLAHLEALLGHVPFGPARARVLKARFRMAPSFRHLWAWLTRK